MTVPARLTTLALVATLAGAEPGCAATVRMICNNTTHDYLVRFDDTRRTFRLDDDTSYGVLSIERQPTKIIVAGTTVGDGPTFRAILDRTPRIEFYMNSKLMQTDHCRY